MRAAALISIIPLLPACGALPQPPREGSSSREAIVGGIADPGDPAVVAILAAGWPACSGTLISPNAVLTAGHCANVLGAGIEYQVAFGSDASAPTRLVQVLQQVTHPDYSGEGKPYDFALFQLAESIDGVTPIPLSTTPLVAADVGTAIRHAGFGVSDELAGTGAGTKRQATYPITEVDPLVVWSNGAGMQTCTGDSGGPGLVAWSGTEQLVGVVSDGPNCHSAGWDGRVDVAAGWIASTAASWAPDAGPAISDAGEPPPAHPSHGGCDGSGEGLGFAPLFLIGAAGLGRRKAVQALGPRG